MCKHTVGPWHLHYPGEDGFPLESGFPEGWEPNFLIEYGVEGTDWGGCMVCGHRGHDDGYNSYQLDDIAALIEHAPRLLRACRAALSHLQATLSNPPLELMLAKAIANATGEVNPYEDALREHDHA